jgi:DNA-directed RNA polymerase II subunit RPB3
MIFLPFFNRSMNYSFAESEKKPFVTIQSRSSDSIAFVLSNVDLSIANGLRRAMIAEVPTMAIDLVEFESNTVFIFD